jgi:predicted Zn-dependent protease
MLQNMLPADVTAIDRAIEKIKAGAINDALPVLLAMREKYPTQFFLEGIIAKAYYAQQDYASASFHFRQVTKHNPSSELASYGLFICLWHLGERHDAFAEMDRYLSVYSPELYVTVLSEIQVEDVPHNQTYLQIIRRLRQRHQGVLKMD